MLIVDQGSVFGLTDQRLLEFLFDYGQGADVDLYAYGCEIGPVMGEVTQVEGKRRSYKPVSHVQDPFADIIVIDGAEAFSLRPDDWFKFVVRATSNPTTSPADYGVSIGPICANLANLTPAEALGLAGRLQTPSSVVQGGFKAARAA